MREVADGVWEIELALKPGTHRFRYMTSNHGWVCDWAAHGMEPNQNGDWDFTVQVPEDGRAVDASPTLLGHVHGDANPARKTGDAASFETGSADRNIGDFRIGGGTDPNEQTQQDRSGETR